MSLPHTFWDDPPAPPRAPSELAEDFRLGYFKPHKGNRFYRVLTYRRNGEFLFHGYGIGSMSGWLVLIQEAMREECNHYALNRDIETKRLLDGECTLYFLINDNPPAELQSPGWAEAREWLLQTIHTLFGTTDVTP